MYEAEWGAAAPATYPHSTGTVSQPAPGILGSPSCPYPMSRLAHLQPAGDADLFADAPPEVERLAVAVVSRIAAVAQDLERLRAGGGAKMKENADAISKQCGRVGPDCS